VPLQDPLDRSAHRAHLVRVEFVLFEARNVAGRREQAITLRQGNLEALRETQHHLGTRPRMKLT
jgi:hypothetical protein